MIFLMAFAPFFILPPVFIVRSTKEADEITDFYIKRPNGFTSSHTLIFAAYYGARS